MIRLILVTLFTLSVSTLVHAAEVKSVSSFNLSRYLGTWHEVARFPARFQKGCKNAKAVYKKLDEEKISVTNSCNRNGKTSVAEGTAIVKGTGRLGVKFSIFQPFRAPYWVLWIDEAYQTVVVGEPGRKFGWILSRSPNRSRASVAEAVQAFEQNGYNTQNLIWN